MLIVKMMSATVGRATKETAYFQKSVIPTAKKTVRMAPAWGTIHAYATKVSTMNPVCRWPACRMFVRADAKMAFVFLQLTTFARATKDTYCRRTPPGAPVSPIVSVHALSRAVRMPHALLQILVAATRDSNLFMVVTALVCRRRRQVTPCFKVGM